MLRESQHTHPTNINTGEVSREPVPPVPAPWIWILTIIELQTLGENQLGVEALAQGQEGQRSSNAEHQEVGQPFVLFRMVEIRHDARWRQHQHRDAVDDRIARHPHRRGRVQEEMPGLGRLGDVGGGERGETRDEAREGQAKMGFPGRASRSSGLATYTARPSI